VLLQRDSQRYQVDEIAFMVKTVERPLCLRRLIHSLREQYPDNPVYVASDGEIEEFTDHNVHYVMFPPDTGAPACYNAVLPTITNPLMVLLDDDFVFTERTRVERFIPWLEVAEVIGGAVLNYKTGLHQNFVGDLAAKNGVMTLHRREVGEGNVAPFFCDVVMNFFMARVTDMLRAPWDPDQKLFRHLDWFITAGLAGLKPMYCPAVSVLHRNESTPRYRELRHQELPKYRARFLEKHHLREVHE